MNECQCITRDLDLAHWIYCYDGKNQEIHCTFLPSCTLMQAHGPQTITVTKCLVTLTVSLTHTTPSSFTRASSERSTW